MYISVDDYRETYLEGREVASVLEEIEKIRREIAKIKKKLESPANVYDKNYAYPSEAAVIDIYKGYLFEALAYVSRMTGEACELTEEEKASLVFDTGVDDIACVTLTVGSYLQDKYEILFNEDGAVLSEVHLGKGEIKKDIDSKRTRESLRALHIGDWKETYTPDQYGCSLNEPTKWQLRIDYNSGAVPRFFDGFGVFPYNFAALARLFGADII